MVQPLCRKNVKEWDKVHTRRTANYAQNMANLAERGREKQNGEHWAKAHNKTYQANTASVRYVHNLYKQSGLHVASKAGCWWLLSSLIIIIQAVLVCGSRRV
jgi:hypothetical protein